MSCAWSRSATAPTRASCAAARTCAPPPRSASSSILSETSIGRQRAPHRGRHRARRRRAAARATIACSARSPRSCATRPEDVLEAVRVPASASAVSSRAALARGRRPGRRRGRRRGARGQRGTSTALPSSRPPSTCADAQALLALVDRLKGRLGGRRDRARQRPPTDASTSSRASPRSSSRGVSRPAPSSRSRPRSVGGGGGGRDTMAQAGGRDPGKLDEALAAARAAIETALQSLMRVRVLALDYGSARCGCALSDPTGTIVTPIEAIARPATRRGLAAIGARRRARRRAVVVGLPLSLDGGDTDQTRETREFAQRLVDALGEGVPVELHDERFTTRIARRSRARSAPARTRARRPTCSRAGCWPGRVSELSSSATCPLTAPSPPCAPRRNASAPVPSGRAAGTAGFPPVAEVAEVPLPPPAAPPPPVTSPPAAPLVPPSPPSPPAPPVPPALRRHGRSPSRGRSPCWRWPSSRARCGWRSTSSRAPAQPCDCAPGRHACPSSRGRHSPPDRGARPRRRPDRQLPDGVQALAAARSRPATARRTAPPISKASCSRPPTTCTADAPASRLVRRAADRLPGKLRRRRHSSRARAARSDALPAADRRLDDRARGEARPATAPTVAAVIYNRLQR